MNGFGTNGALRVLHFSHYDLLGGAARSAYRLHEGLRRCGVSSRMLVGQKDGDDPDVRAVERSRGDRLAERLEGRLGVQYLLRPSTFRLCRDPWLREADVVQLANIHGGFFAHTALPLLSHGKRLVWCLHDMWAVTGHCGYSLDSERWLTGCGACPYLDSYPRVRRDATRFNWRVKQAVYRRLDLTVVTPSGWLAGVAGRSPLLGRFTVHVIPNGVDAELFTPAPRQQARRELGLQQDGAVVLVSDVQRRKGAGVLPLVLGRAQEAAGVDVTLLIAGAVSSVDLPVGVRSHLLGQVDERRMALAYSAADAFLLPTLMDNLPNTVLEALACSTAVVASAVGGVPELIDDGRTGLLAPLEADALGVALGRVLADRELGSRLGTNGRAEVVERFTLERQARAYLDLYASLSP